MSTVRTETEITCEVASLMAALATVFPVVPTRSPKPVLQNVLLTADPESGSTLSATNLELGVSVRLVGVQASGRARVVLPPSRLSEILKGCVGRTETLRINVSGGESGQSAELTGRGFNFEIPLENEATYPGIPAPDPSSPYSTLDPSSLATLVRRTSFAADPDSTKYALGGCMAEVGDGTLSFIATDGRRLSRQTAPAAPSGGSDAARVSGVVVPLKAVKLMERLCDPKGPPVDFILTKDAAFLRTDRATLYSRLVEGRFPKYQDIFPEEKLYTGKASFRAGDFLWAAEQAGIMTSDDSRAVDVTFTPLGTTIRASAADRGKGRVDADLSYQGPEMEVTFDARYLAACLASFDPDARAVARIVSEKYAVVFALEDSGEYAHIIMPITA